MKVITNIIGMLDYRHDGNQRVANEFTINTKKNMPVAVRGKKVLRIYGVENLFIHPALLSGRKHAFC
jgi:hypothetical protein